MQEDEQGVSVVIRCNVFDAEHAEYRTRRCLNILSEYINEFNKV